MPIPRNTSSVLDAINNAKPKAPVKPVTATKTEEEHPENNGARVSAGRDEAKLRARAKKAEADLVAITAERDTLKQQVDTLTPAAKKWNDYEHIEKSKLIDSLPPELKKDAKDMQLHHLRMFAKGNASTEQKKAEEKTVDPTDIDAIQKSGDKKAMNDYVEAVKAGKIVPTPPKSVAVAA